MASLGDLLGVGDCHDSASVVLGGGLTFAGDAFTFSEERDASLAFLGALACACKAGIVSVVCLLGLASAGLLICSSCFFDCCFLLFDILLLHYLKLIIYLIDKFYIKKVTLIF
jgi:hypothetical protein